MKDYRKEILQPLRYFAFFEYAPTFEEVYTFLPVKITQKMLKNELAQIKEVVFMDPRLRGNDKDRRYTLGEYSILVASPKSEVESHKSRPKADPPTAEKVESSGEKIKKVKRFVSILSWFPQIKLIGLSGSVAMMNACEKDDIDLFIITARGRMWTGRIIGLFLAHIMGLRRRRGLSHATDKVCLNLFFDESDLALPAHKHTEYGGHEVLQMKPLVSKDGIYKKFLWANQWVFSMFPNAQYILSLSKDHLDNSSNDHISAIFKMTIIGRLIILIETLLEQLLKALQLFIIKKHRTSEIITDTQLWFFPDDFEKKMRKNR